jgi:hypothetical protein
MRIGKTIWFDILIKKIKTDFPIKIDSKLIKPTEKPLDFIEKLVSSGF